MMPEQLIIDEGYWYLATPYTKYYLGIEVAYHHASSVAGSLIKNGIKVYCPIAHTHPIAKYGGLDPCQHEIFLALDLPFMLGAHGLLVVQMPGWKESYGMQVEIENFTNQEKPIHYLPWPNIWVNEV